MRWMVGQCLQHFLPRHQNPVRLDLIDSFWGNFTQSGAEVTEHSIFDNGEAINTIFSSYYRLPTLQRRQFIFASLATAGKVWASQSVNVITATATVQLTCCLQYQLDFTSLCISRYRNAKTPGYKIWRKFWNSQHALHAILFLPRISRTRVLFAKFHTMTGSIQYIHLYAPWKPPNPFVSFPFLPTSTLASYVFCEDLHH